MFLETEVNPSYMTIIDSIPFFNAGIFVTHKKPAH